MTIDQLKARRKSKKNSFNTFVKRRDAINKIISNIDNKLDDDVRDINSNISNCVSKLGQGLKVSNSRKVSTVSSSLDSVRENYAGSDGKISSVRSYLMSEKNRCQNNINSLDYEIKQLENQIKAQGGTIYFWE